MRKNITFIEIINILLTKVIRLYKILTLIIINKNKLFNSIY